MIDHGTAEGLAPAEADMLFKEDNLQPAAASKLLRAEVSHPPLAALAKLSLVNGCWSPSGQR